MHFSRLPIALVTQGHQHVANPIFGRENSVKRSRLRNADESEQEAHDADGFGFGEVEPVDSGSHDGFGDGFGDGFEDGLDSGPGSAQRNLGCDSSDDVHGGVAAGGAGSAPGLVHALEKIPADATTPGSPLAAGSAGSGSMQGKVLRPDRDLSPADVALRDQQCKELLPGGVPPAKVQA